MVQLTDLSVLAAQVGEVLLNSTATLVTAESCTGGWVAQEITAIAGSSQWFDRGFVTYTNLSKQEMLDVTEQTLIDSGAVSEQTVLEMASGAIDNSHANISLAVSGIAGPGGGSDDKPVGTVWFAWADDSGRCDVQQYLLEGDRQQIRHQAVAIALQGVIDRLGNALA